MSKYNTYEAIIGLSTPDSEFAEILKHLPQPNDTATPKLEEAIQLARTSLHAAEQAGCRACKELDVRETVKTIPMRDGFQSQIRIFQPPKSSTVSAPLIILIFGGGFISGSEIQYTPFSRLFATIFGATVVNLSYRLAPENKFPAAPHDVWDSMVWIVDHARELEADPEVGFILGGGSAGGNLTLVNAQKWQDMTKSPPLTGVFASIPVFLEEQLVPKEYEEFYLSRKQNAEAPLLNQKLLEIISEAYGADFSSPDFSPMNAEAPFCAFPPTYIQVAGLDPLRDDGLILQRMLERNSIATKLDVYPGVPHGHQGALPQLAQSRKTVIDTILGIGWLLKKDVTEQDLKMAEDSFYV